MASTDQVRGCRLGHQQKAGAAEPHAQDFDPLAPVWRSESQAARRSPQNRKEAEESEFSFARGKSESLIKFPTLRFTSAIKVPDLEVVEPIADPVRF
jgi:hypothetical protein